MIPGGLDAPDARLTVMMGIGPIQTEDLAPAPAMVSGYDGAMTRHQPVRIPGRLKDGFVHSPAAGGRAVFPHVQIVNPL
jgi:hypothetical protein